MARQTLFQHLRLDCVTPPYVVQTVFFLHCNSKHVLHLFDLEKGHIGDLPGLDKLLPKRRVEFRPRSACASSVLAVSFVKVYCGSYVIATVFQWKHIQVHRAKVGVSH